MDAKDILRESRLNLPIIARAAHIDLGYLKQISAGNAQPGADTKAKLADALERHAEALREYVAALRS